MCAVCVCGDCVLSRVSRRLGVVASECVCGGGGGGGDPLSLTTGRNGRHRPRSTRPPDCATVDNRARKKEKKKEKIFFFFLFCSGEKAKGSTVLFYKSISARHSQHGVRIYCPDFWERKKENCLSRQKEKERKKGNFLFFSGAAAALSFLGLSKHQRGRRSHLYNAYLYTLASHLRATQQQQQPNGFDSAPSPKEFCVFLLLFDISLRWIISSQVRVSRVQKRFSRSTHVLLSVCVCVYGSGGRAAAAPAVKFSRHPVVSRT